MINVPAVRSVHVMTSVIRHAEAYKYRDQGFKVASRPLCEAPRTSADKRREALRGPLVTCLWCMARL